MKTPARFEAQRQSLVQCYKMVWSGKHAHFFGVVAIVLSGCELQQRCEGASNCPDDKVCFNGICVGAIDGTEGEGEGEGEAPTDDATVAASELLEALGSFYLQCQAGLVIAVDGQPVANLLADGFAASRLSYPAGTAPDLAAFEACIALFNATDCTGINDLDSPCARLLVPTREQGAPCQNNDVCLDGLCDQTSGSTCGICSVGDPCSFDFQCAQNEFCNDSVGLCQPLGAIGDACGGDGACAGNNICLIGDGGTGTCSTPIANDAPCLDFSGCRRDSFCNDLQVCTALPGDGESCSDRCLGNLICLTGTCVDVQRARTINAPCTAGSDLNSCSTFETGLFCSNEETCAPVVVVEIGQGCDTAYRFCRGSAQAGLSACINGNCVAGVVVGDACIDPALGNAPPCIQGSLCEGGACVLFPSLGGPCTDQCSTGNICNAGTCAQLAQLNEACGEAVCGNGTCVGGTCRFLPEEDICPVDG